MKKLFAIALGVLALAACNREAQPQRVATGRQEVRFTTNVNTFTLKAGETALEGKTINIFAGAPIDKQETGVVAGTSVTLANKLYWQDGQTAKTSFGATYPEEQSSASIDYDLNYGDNQDYAYASSVLVASAPNVTPEETVALNFKHPFSNIVITVTNKIEGAAIDAVYVDDVKASGNINVLSGEIVAAEAVTTVAATPDAATAGIYRLLVFPGKMQPVIRIVMGETSYKFVLAQAFTFEANKSYSAAITVDDSTEPVVPGGEVNFTLTVGDWEDVSEDLGFVSEDEVPEVWAVIGLGGDWDTDIAMTETSEGVWEADITYAAGDSFKLRKDGSWDVEAGRPNTAVAPVPGDGSEYGLWGTDNLDITLAVAGKYHIKFIPEGYKFYATLTEAAPAAPAAVTVYVSDTTGWDSIYLYTWKDGVGTVGAAWPGVAPASEKEIESVTYKAFELGEEVVGESLHLIFNNGAGTQLGDYDLTFTEGVTEYYLVVSAEGVTPVE